METGTQRIFLTLMRVAGLALLTWPVLAADRNAPLIEPDVKPVPVDEALIDNENIEIGAFAGVLTIEDFGSSFLWGGRLTYHLSESLFAEANVGFARGGQTSFEKLAGDVQLIPDGDRDYTFYNVNLGYTLLPGEAFVGSDYAFNTNFYLIAGAGATDFAGDNRFTVNVGAGYQVLLTDSLALNLGVREHFFNIDVLGEQKTAINTEVSGGLSVFF